MKIDIGNNVVEVKEPTDIKVYKKDKETNEFTYVGTFDHASLISVYHVSEEVIK